MQDGLRVVHEMGSCAARQKRLSRALRYCRGFGQKKATQQMVDVLGIVKVLVMDMVDKNGHGGYDQ